jgi:hypothetical protein
VSDVKEVDAFHKHLDECKQCEENPFDLCIVGRLLFERASKAVTNALPTMFPVPEGWNKEDR